MTNRRHLSSLEFDFPRGRNRLCGLSLKKHFMKDEDQHVFTFAICRVYMMHLPWVCNFALEHMQNTFVWLRWVSNRIHDSPSLIGKFIPHWSRNPPEWKHGAQYISLLFLKLSSSVSSIPNSRRHKWHIKSTRSSLPFCNHFTYTKFAPIPVQTLYQGASSQVTSKLFLEGFHWSISL